MDTVCLRAAPAALFAPILHRMAGLAGGADRTLMLWAACTLVAAAAASVGWGPPENGLKTCSKRHETQETMVGRCVKGHSTDV